MENFNSERLLMADEASSYAEVYFEEVLAWVRERHTFGVPLVQHQVTRHRLVDMRMRMVSTSPLYYITVRRFAVTSRMWGGY